ncbi:MAG: thioredoxin-dependent thiol peroxidase [Propionibacterium sp.]|nr:MAG: thioredoxin-dependent thiol peroxidase [Propionibacterium sp.]
MSVRLNIGSTAPAFTLPNSENQPISLSDYAKQTVVVYFYPAAMTPGCTKQAKDFTENLADFKAAGYEIIGISPDEVEKLAKFREKSELAITLLADPDKEISSAYGAFGTKKMYGKEFQGIIRSTFVIDVNAEGIGTIREAQYNVRATGHVAKLRRDLGM